MKLRLKIFIFCLLGLMITYMMGGAQIQSLKWGHQCDHEWSFTG